MMQKGSLRLSIILGFTYPMHSNNSLPAVQTSIWIRWRLICPWWRRRCWLNSGRACQNYPHPLLHWAVVRRWGVPKWLTLPGRHRWHPRHSHCHSCRDPRILKNRMKKLFTKDTVLSVGTKATQVSVWGECVLYEKPSKNREYISLYLLCFNAP